MEIAEDQGWDAAKAFAPKTTEYLQDVLIPLIREKCKEEGAKLDHKPGFLRRFWEDDSAGFLIRR